MRGWKRLRAWFIAARLERELAEEIDAHRKALEEQSLRDGMSASEARLSASRRLGNVTAAIERTREEWRVQWIDSIAQDLRFALRLIRRQPLLTAAAVLTVALGVGANTAVTSVLETALLNPLGLGDTRGVVVASVHVAKLQMWDSETSAVEFRELSEMRDTFAAAGASEGRSWTAEGDGEATRLLGRAVTPDFFKVFNERPALGRFFTADDREALVLSYRLWQSRFGGDPGTVGRTMTIDGKPYRIVGVASEHFRLPANVDAWAPLVIDPSRFHRRGYAMMLTVFARLRDGVSQAQAADRVNRYVAGLDAAAEGYEGYGYGIDLRAFAPYVAGDLRRPLLLVWVAALLVLVTGCANVAGLLLARSTGRKKEIAIRFSLGASGVQVLRQLLVEALVLGSLGGAAGIGVAYAGVSLARRLTLPGGTLLTLVHVDGRLVLYALAVSLVTALLFGLAPAVQLLRHDQASALVRSRRRFQSVFVVAEVAAASALLVVTALLVRSLWAVQQVQPGFDTTHVTTGFVLKPQNDVGFLDRLDSRLRVSAGVDSAALAYPLPFAVGGLTSSFSIKNREHRPNDPEWHGEAYLVSPGYLRTMRIPLLAGRNISDADSARAPLVCLIDSKFAQRFFPGQDAIGQEIAMYRGWARIVGVVGSIRATALEGVSRPVVYYSLPQVPFFPSVAVVVRSPVPAAPLIRRAIKAENGGVPLFDIATMDERVARSLGVRRVVVDLLGVFACITLLLSAIGVHSVVAQVVSERTPEIGIRMALGARPSQVLRHFLAQGLRAGVVGLVVGLAAASYAQRWIATLLFGIQPFDGAAFVVASVGLLLVLAVAVWWPARRAAAIDPQVALRYE